MVLDHASGIHFSRLSGSTFGGGDVRIVVVTPSYNQADYVAETIESVVDQMTGNDRYVIADGGSVDGSVEILRRYRDRVTDILWGPDAGQSNAIMRAAERAIESSGWHRKPVWFNWINSDDRLRPDCLRQLRDVAMRHPGADAIAMNVQTIGDAEYPMFNRNLSARRMIRDDTYHFAQPGLWLRLDKMQQIGGIDTRLQYGFDWDLTVRYLARFPRVIYCQTVGAEFRLHDQSKTSIEHSKTMDVNQFEVEHDEIRRRLSDSLPPWLAKDCGWGARRRRWHQQLASIMDQIDQPVSTGIHQILSATAADPKPVASRRTMAAVIRLLSRYGRPRSSYQK